MHRDRFILALLLCAFFALGACDTFEDDDEKDKFPDRAPAANNLLRHYYDSNTFPENMTAIKIPEGTEFEDDELVVEMPMGGTEVINDVRVRLYLVPPDPLKENTPDVECRVEAPDGTKSGWQPADFIYGSARDGGTGVDLQYELRFANDFDGVTSGGEWKILLRDPIKDEDGRCLFRNATLRLNGGLPTGATTGSESVTLDLLTGPYDLRIPEEKGTRYFDDLADIGIKNVLRAEFTFTGGFNVTGHTLSLTIRSLDGTDLLKDLSYAILSPSGGWVIPGFPDNSTFTPVESGSMTWTRFDVGSMQATPEIGNSYIFLGEPAGGTWTLLLWDVTDDNLSFFLSPDDGSTDPVTQNVEASLSLF